VRSWKT